MQAYTMAACGMHHDKKMPRRTYSGQERGSPDTISSLLLLNNAPKDEEQEQVVAQMLPARMAEGASAASNS